MFAQQLTNGVVLGCIYALCALGFTLIFGVARIVNFAYGELLMLGAFVTLSVMPYLGIGFFTALPIGMAAIAALSVLVYVLTVRPVMRGTPLKALLVTTGVLYVLREVAIFTWGTAPRQMDMGVDGAVEIGEIIVTHTRLVAIATMVVLVLALYTILYRMRIGKALRAVLERRRRTPAE